LEDSIDRYEKEIVIFFCQSGMRSAKAAQWLQAHGGNYKTIYSLQGGILNYLKQRKEQKL
jgi:predicted sulfurtransferase